MTEHKADDGTASSSVAEMVGESDERDETARQRVAVFLAERNELDRREARYRQLVAQYGSNRRARRRARAEVRKRSAAR